MAEASGTSDLYNELRAHDGSIDLKLLHEMAANVGRNILYMHQQRGTHVLGISTEGGYDDTADNPAHVFIPQSYKEAIGCKDSAYWTKAIQDEMDSITTNETWEECHYDSRLRKRKPLAGKWVFKVKTNPDGTVARYKARFVVKGYRQKEGIDYNETFASVVRTQTYLFLFALAASKRAHVHLMDVKTAFLQGDINEEIFI
jgi:hypothetical protein